MEAVNMEKKTKETKKPVASANSYGVSTAIWNNTNKQGKEYQSISMNASTKLTDGSYKNRTIFFPSDLENLIKSLTELKTQADELGIKTGFEQKE
jgi:hypothetical protein